MKQLSINVSPLSFTSPGIIYDTELMHAEHVSITAADSDKIARFAIEHGISEIMLYGSTRYTNRIKAKIEKDLVTKYSDKQQITVTVKGVA